MTTKSLASDSVSLRLFVKRILASNSPEYVQFSTRSLGPCRLCGPNASSCEQDDLPYRCKPCAKRQRTCSWKEIFVVEFTMHEFGCSKEKAEELYTKKGHGLRSNGSMGKKKTTNVEEDREMEEGSQSRVPKRPINGDGGVIGFSMPQNFPGHSSLADECSTNGVRSSKRRRVTAIENSSIAPLDLNGDSSTFRGEAEASKCLPTRSLAPLVAPPSHIEVRVLKSHSETLARQLSAMETKYDEVISKLEVAIEDKSTVNAAIANLQAELETMKQRNGSHATSTKGVGTTRISTGNAVNTEILCEASSPERTVWEAEKNSTISGLAIDTPQKELLEALWVLEKINTVLIRMSRKSQEETMTQLKDLKVYVEEEASKYRGYG